MILQTLTEYYFEQTAIGNPLYAPQGMELKRIHFVLVITPDGVLVDIEQPRQKMSVIKSCQRGGKNASSTANYMWDSLGYVTGYGADEKQQAAATIQHRSFVSNVSMLARKFPENQSFKAVYTFYSKEQLIERLSSHSLWDKIISQKGHNLSFRLMGETLLAAQQPELTFVSGEQIKNGSICMIRGQKAAIQLKHPKIYIPGGAGTGSKLISFTQGCGYDSYYKHGGDNAPISIEIAECYAAALTGLLQQESENSVVIDKVSILYYTLPHTAFNALFRTLLDPSIKSGGEEALAQLKKYTHRKEEFVIMAIVPNAARLSVRLFLRTTVGSVATHMIRFYKDTEIAHTYSKHKVLPVMASLFMVAPQGNIGKMAPQLVVDYLHAIVTGSPLPVALQYELLNRLREQRQPKTVVASLLRCCLNRNKQKYIPMALDKENKNTGYLLGRTFAILERAQELSAPGIHFTIRDTYFHMASITPSAVFNRLIGLSSTFFRKIPSQATAIYLKIQLGEVTAMLHGDTIPIRLSTDDQSRFALGYFHQRQTYFLKKEQQDG